MRYQVQPHETGSFEKGGWKQLLFIQKPTSAFWSSTWNLMYMNWPFLLVDPNLDPQLQVPDFTWWTAKTRSCLPNSKRIIDNTKRYEGFKVVWMVEFAKPNSSIDDLIKIETLSLGTLENAIKFKKTPKTWWSKSWVSQSTTTNLSSCSRFRSTSLLEQSCKTCSRPRLPGFF